MSSITLSCRLEREKIEAGKTHEMHLVVSLKGIKHSPANRKPLVLGIGFDASGSMAGAKIDYARRTALKLIDQMTESDTLGICAFSTQVWTVFKAEKMTAEAKERARAAVSQLTDLEATNLSGGLTEAYALTREASADSVVRSLLFTDGQPTSGVTDKPRLVDLAGSLKPAHGGLSCFGFGDYDADLLDQMARKGGGACYHIDSMDKIGPTFGKELGGLVSFVAQNIKVTIAGKTGVKLLEVLNDFDVDASADKSQATVHMDDVLSEETRDLVVKIEVPAIEKGERPFKLGDIKIEYLDLTKNEPRTEEIPFKVQYVEKDEAQKDQDTYVANQLARMQVKKAQEQAMDLAKAGNFTGAQAAIKGAAINCRMLGTPMAMAMAEDLDGQVMHRMSADGFASGGHHYVMANARSYDQGRAHSAGVEGLFCTQTQLDTAKKFEDGAGVGAGVHYVQGKPSVTPGVPSVMQPPFGQSPPRNWHTPMTPPGGSGKAHDPGCMCFQCGNQNIHRPAVMPPAVSVPVPPTLEKRRKHRS